MKKLLFLGVFLFLGCVSKHPCLDKREVCLNDCERIYQKGVEYNICKSACCTAYATCKAKREVKKIFQEKN